MELSASIPLRKPSVVIQPHRGLFHLDLAPLWRYRELLFFLVWRDVLTRYKQTVIGASWAILQPLVTMAIFTIIFGRMVNISSDGKPYAIFAFAALVPWGYFSQAFGRCSNSLVASANLVTKIYFPRLLIPLAAAVSPVVDLFFSFLILLVLMFWYGFPPTWSLMALPLFALLLLLTVLAFGLWLAALNVKYRDVGHVIPFLIQIWMYAAPVVYPVSLVPERWRLLYSLNPLVGIIEAFRWAILGTPFPEPAVCALGLTVVTVLFVGGLVYFKKMEQTFADVI